MKFLQLKQALEARQQAGEMRSRLCIESAQGKYLQLANKQLLNFASNDYLGLANSNVAKQAIHGQLDESGFGSGASHLICGHQQAHHDLEIGLANFVERDAALTFSSGYAANLAIMQSLSKKGDLIIADKLNHASLIDGAQLSCADSVRYAHSDLLQLEQRLKQSSQNKFVVTDSIFSMDGDCARLPEIVELCEKYQAILIVDDAHGFGVLGKSGGGVTQHFGLSQQQVPVLMSTLGKALGGYGAFVSGEQSLVDYLIQFARTYIYTTAMPAIIARGNLANLNFLKMHPQLLTGLADNIQLFKQLCAQQKIPLLESDCAIQPILVGDSLRLMQLNEILVQQNILVGAIRPPSVAKNAARFRVTLTAAHQAEDIQQLVSGLAFAFSTNKTQ